MSTSRFRTGVLSSHISHVYDVAFSPDSQWLATASRESIIRLWNVKVHNVLKLNTVTPRQIATHTSWVNQVEFSPDGKYLASASHDTTIRLWDMERNEEAIVLRGHKDAVVSFAFSSDGRLLASVGKDKILCIWNIEKQQLLMSIQDEEWINCVTFSPNGCYLATGNGTGLVRVWGINQNIS